MCGVILTRLWPLNPNLDLRTSVDEKQLVKLMVTTDPSARLRPSYAASEFHANGTSLSYARWIARELW